MVSAWITATEIRPGKVVGAKNNRRLEVYKKGYLRTVLLTKLNALQSLREHLAT